MPKFRRGQEFHGASWLGHRFVDIGIDGIEPAEPVVPEGAAAGGTLHYKYIPATGIPGEADVAYACHTPPGAGGQCILSFHRAEGTVRFNPTTWEDMPTQFHIVQRLATLPVVEARCKHHRGPRW